MVQLGIHLVAPCFLPRKPALTGASSRSAPILIQALEAARVYVRSMAALGAAVTKASTLMTRAISGLLKMSAALRYKIMEETQTHSFTGSFLYISGRPDSWQIAGAPSLDQR